MKIVIYSVLLILLVGCSDSKTQKSSTKETIKVATASGVMTEDITILPAVEITPEGQAVIQCQTNLPDNTSLIITLFNEKTGFSAQFKDVVKDGVFESVPMGPKTGLASGEYLVDMSMPIIDVQSNNVKKILGETGEHMRGHLLKEGEMGKTVSISFTFNVGSKEAEKKDAIIHKELLSNVKSKLSELANIGIEMQDLPLDECGDKMRLHQLEADELRAQAAPLSTSYLELKAATIEVKMCVSCKKSALDFCNRVLSTL